MTHYRSINDTSINQWYIINQSMIHNQSINDTYSQSINQSINVQMCNFPKIWRAVLLSFDSLQRSFMPRYIYMYVFMCGYMPLSQYQQTPRDSRPSVLTCYSLEYSPKSRRQNLLRLSRRTRFLHFPHSSGVSSSGKRVYLHIRAWRYSRTVDVTYT